MREGAVGPGAAHERVQDSALVHVLQVAQVFAQVLLRWITLRRESGFEASRRQTGGRMGTRAGVGGGRSLPALSRTP